MRLGQRISKEGTVRLTFRLFRAAMLIAAIVPAVLAPTQASAQNVFEALFGLGSSQNDQRSPIARFFADPFGLNDEAAPPPPKPNFAGYGPAYCVRSCDGKYFPLQSRAGITPAQSCQAFCPASPTRVFMGSSIDNAATSTGERYALSENAFAFRTALKADCTCNGRDPAGLAPIELSQDTSLRPGDIVATNSGLVAYTGAKSGNAEFTPVASYPGLTNEVRTRLGEIKVAPVIAETIAQQRVPVVGAHADTPPPQRRQRHTPVAASDTTARGL